MILAKHGSGSHQRTRNALAANEPDRRDHERARRRLMAPIADDTECSVSERVASPEPSPREHKRIPAESNAQTPVIDERRHSKPIISPQPSPKLARSAVTQRRGSTTSSYSYSYSYSESDSDTSSGDRRVPVAPPRDSQATRTTRKHENPSSQPKVVSSSRPAHRANLPAATNPRAPKTQQVALKRRTEPRQNTRAVEAPPSRDAALKYLPYEIRSPEHNELPLERSVPLASLKPVATHADRKVEVPIPSVRTVVVPLPPGKVKTSCFC